MHRRNFLSHAASLGSIFFSASAFGRSQPSRLPTSTSISADVDKSITKLMSSVHLPGLAVAIIENGKVSWSRGYGVLDYKSKKPVNAHTIFECASMSKTVFSYAALKLIEKGVIELDKPLVTYRPDPWVQDPRAKLITARHILSHTSGLPNWRVSDAPEKLSFDPGTSFQYSGEGMCYLQTVITALKGKVDTKNCGSFEADFKMCATDIGDYLKVNVLDPVGMSSSGYVWDEVIGRNYALPHDQEGNYFAKHHQTALDMARYAAAGGLLTSVNDYAKFMINLFEGKENHRFFLNRATLLEALKPQVTLPDDQHIDGATSWGLGWAVMERPEGNVIIHSGGHAGYQSLSMASVLRKSGFVILSNANTGVKVIYNPELLGLLDKLFTT